MLVLSVAVPRLSWGLRFIVRAVVMSVFPRTPIVGVNRSDALGAYPDGTISLLEANVRPGIE